ncbi:MAG TPA: fibronectin type III domain-containing protein, partial [Acidimicrobiales bacterium]|nr:fibronectin type III domain-containing protein [Acidimicrobiales bacterium]
RSLSLAAGPTSLVATWAPVAGATSYTCTLMTGTLAPTARRVTTTSTRCAYAGLMSGREYGVSVTANNAHGASVAAARFARL